MGASSLRFLITSNPVTTVGTTIGPVSHRISGWLDYCSLSISLLSSRITEWTPRWVFPHLDHSSVLGQSSELLWTLISLSLTWDDNNYFIGNFPVLNDCKYLNSKGHMENIIEVLAIILLYKFSIMTMYHITLFHSTIGSIYNSAKKIIMVLKISNDAATP